MQVTVSLQPGSRPRLAAIASKLNRPSVQGLILAILFIAIVAVSYMAYNWLWNAGSYWSYDFSLSGWSDALYWIWIVVLFSTAALASFLVLFALPIVWGRRFGWKRVFVIICCTLLVLFAALVVGAFILYINLGNGDSQQNNLCAGSNFDVTGNYSCTSPL